MNDPENKKGCGCIARGCAFMVIVAGILIGVLLWGGKRIVAGISARASGSPVAVAVGNGTEDEYDALVKRLDDFKSAPPGAGKTLELSADDLNLLVKFSPEWEPVRGRMRASIEKDRIGLAGGLPLDCVPMLVDFAPALAGKYLNGEMHFTLSREDSMFHCSVQDVRMEGRELSGEAMKTFSACWMVCLASYQIPVLGPVLIKARAIAVKDGIITLTSR